MAKKYTADIIEATSITGSLLGTATLASALVPGNKTVEGDLTVTGKITAEEFHTEYVSSSIVYTSGSTKFGDSSDDVMSVTGSLQVQGSITGSLFGTASYAMFAATPTVQGVQGIQGIAGDLGGQGAQGIQGIQGTAGYVGSDGAQGIQGITGIQGTQGIQGVGGSIGGQGTQGSTGAQGTTGQTGAQGSTGAQGTTGAQGLTGFQGSTGNQGTTGAQGVAGPQGVQGIQGVQGPNAGITSYTNASDNRVITSVSSTAINAESNLIFDGTSLVNYGSESREVSSYLPGSYTTNDLVSGTNYKWYSDVWRLGATRSGGASAADFVIQFNGVNKFNLGTNGAVTATSFGGAGTGLTGTASSLSIGGTAASETLATVTGRGALTTGNIFTPVNGGIFFNGNGAYNTGVYGSSNDLWFNAGSTQKAALNSSGDFTANASSRAPLFYDSNNTGYYIDPASTSNVYTLGVANYIDVASHLYTRAAIYTLNSAGNGWNTIVDRNGGDSWIVYGGNSMRAPIFYDSNNTGYYVDPASSTTSMYMNGGMVTTAPGGTVLMKHAVSEVDAWLFQENAANWGLYWKNNPSGNHTFGQYTSIGAEFVGMSGANASGNGVLTSNFVGATSAYAQWMLSNYTGYMWSASTIYAGGDMRTPVFYDANDTSYYADFNSTSDSAIRVRGGALHGPNPTWGAYLLVGGDGRQNYTNSTTVASVCASNGNLHLDAASGYQTYINFYDGDVVNFGNGANNTVSTINTDGSHRPQIIYDYNNTNYYVDPNGTSRMGTINADTLVSYGVSYASATGGFANSTYAVGVRNPIWRFGNADGYGLSYFQGSAGQDGGDTIGFHFGTASNAGSQFKMKSDGTFYASGDIIAYASSDRELKDNILPIENALEKVKQIGGYTFDWNDKQDTYKGHDIGVIAQEIEAILPEVVTTRDSGYKAVKYEKIVPLLIQAIKEQQTQIENQQSQIDELKSLVKQLLG